MLFRNGNLVIVIRLSESRGQSNCQQDEQVYELSRAASRVPFRRIVGRCRCEGQIRKACTRRDAPPWLMETPCYPAAISRECTLAFAKTAWTHWRSEYDKRRHRTNGIEKKTIDNFIDAAYFAIPDRLMNSLYNSE